MILQALTEYYQALSASHDEKIPPFGWGNVKVSFALSIDDQGALDQVISLKTEQTRGKKVALAPQILEVPAPVKRSSGVAANFLCDNSGYILGIDNKGKPQRTRECFLACKTLHEQLLTAVDSPAARALLAFFRSWRPEQALNHPALAEYLEDILSGANLVFFHGGHYLHDDPAVRRAWDEAYRNEADGPEMVCLVTGEKGPVELTHPSIKNVRGAQSSGAALVSFNAPAFCSYGKEQNAGAPVGKFATFAYTTALNHLLTDTKQISRVGDTTVVCWAQNTDLSYTDFFLGAVFGLSDSAPYTAESLMDTVKKLAAGEPVDFDETKLDPNMEFYILGLAPNASRLSVRFFLHNSFGVFMENLRAHQERLDIVTPSFLTAASQLPLWRLLGETVNQNARDKTPSPQMSGAVFRSILTNTPYPATLLNGTVLRIRAEHDITPGRAAILKAYYLKNPNKDIPKEVLTVSLNRESTNIPYLLGRLFSVLEAIQQRSNPGLNTTIKDKYFNSASATPGHIFPVLLNLAQKHLNKLSQGEKIYFDKQLSEILARLPEAFPDHLNLPQQGSFQLGYYHQNQSRYTKKEEQNND